MVRSLYLLLAVLILLPIHGPVARAKDADYQALKRISELIAGEPDPIRRIVNFEELVSEKSQLKSEFAIRSALGVDDSQLHAVALRAYLNAAQDITFIWDLPEAASENPQRNLTSAYNELAGAIPIRFGPVREDGAFTIKSFGAIYEEVEGHIVGDKVRFYANLRTNSGVSPKCSFELSPTPDLKLAGQMRCGRLWPGAMKVSADMY